MTRATEFSSVSECSAVELSELKSEVVGEFSQSEDRCREVGIAQSV
jgi:hypothetical protein